METMSDQNNMDMTTTTHIPTHNNTDVDVHDSTSCSTPADVPPSQDTISSDVSSQEHSNINNNNDDKLDSNHDANKNDEKATCFFSSSLARVRSRYVSLMLDEILFSHAVLHGAIVLYTISTCTVHLYANFADTRDKGLMQGGKHENLHMRLIKLIQYYLNYYLIANHNQLNYNNIKYIINLTIPLFFYKYIMSNLVLMGYKKVKKIFNVTNADSTLEKLYILPCYMTLVSLFQLYAFLPRSLYVSSCATIVLCYASLCALQLVYFYLLIMLLSYGYATGSRMCDALWRSSLVVAGIMALHHKLTPLYGRVFDAVQSIRSMVPFRRAHAATCPIHGVDRMLESVSSNVMSGALSTTASLLFPAAATAMAPIIQTTVNGATHNILKKIDESEREEELEHEREEIEHVDIEQTEIVDENDEFVWLEHKQRKHINSQHTEDQVETNKDDPTSLHEKYE